MGKRKPYRVEEEGFVSAPLLTIGEAARHMGVGRRVIYELIELGEITVVKAAGRVLVEKKSLDDFRAAGKLP